MNTLYFRACQLSIFPKHCSVFDLLQDVHLVCQDTNSLLLQFSFLRTDGNYKYLLFILITSYLEHWLLDPATRPYDCGIWLQNCRLKRVKDIRIGSCVFHSVQTGKNWHPPANLERLALYLYWWILILVLDYPLGSFQWCAIGTKIGWSQTMDQCVGMGSFTWRCRITFVGKCRKRYNDSDMGHCYTTNSSSSFRSHSVCYIDSLGRLWPYLFGITGKLLI
jgi:hypothetical protein